MTLPRDLIFVRHGQSENWQQHPTIGSLRAAARSVDAVQDDWLFIRRIRPSAIDVTVVRDADLPADPEARLRALVGSTDAAQPLEQVLADALGLRGTVNHDLTEERAALAARREAALVELIDAIEAGPRGKQ